VIRARLLVSGRVQGVYFRGSTAKEAERLGLTGWVKNLADGRVEAVVEGPKEAVEELVAWCWKGPPSAKVDDVAVQRTPATGEHRSFEVVR
jgi:acylphosphatase